MPTPKNNETPREVAAQSAIKRAKAATRWGHFESNGRLYVYCPSCRAKVDTPKPYKASPARALNAALVEHFEDCEVQP